MWMTKIIPSVLTTKKNNMKIQLISFDYCLNPNNKLKIFKKVSESSDADLILFPSLTLRDEADLTYSDVDNWHSSMIFELEEADPTCCVHAYNELYLMRNGVYEDMYSCQVFADTHELADSNVVSKFFSELSQRTRKWYGKRITILQSEEILFLDYFEDGGVGDELKKMYLRKCGFIDKFDELIEGTDIFLHLRQDLGDVHNLERCKALSENNKFCFSTGSLDEKSEGKLRSSKLQTACHNGVELISKAVVDRELGYVSRVFEIE